MGLYSGTAGRELGDSLSLTHSQDEVGQFSHVYRGICPTLGMGWEQQMDLFFAAP